MRLLLEKARKCLNELKVTLKELMKINIDLPVLNYNTKILGKSSFTFVENVCVV